jgi:DNA-binding NtrC family response regulator
MKKDMKVLVVDDEPLLRDIIAYNIADEGYTVLQASGGHEALELIEKETIHLVITDMRMPNGTGEELLRALQSKKIRPQVILVSGACELSREDVIKLGALDFLYKPFNIETINEHAQKIYDSL